MTHDEELRAAMMAPSLEVWLDARCGLGERAYLDWARAAIAAAAEAHQGVPGSFLSRVQASASAWAAEPSREHAETTTSLAFERTDEARLETRQDGSTTSHAQRAVLLAAAVIDSVGASWRENAELAIVESRKALGRHGEDAKVRERIASVLVAALRAPAPVALPRPRDGVRPGSLVGPLPELPPEWRWHADWDPSLARHTRAIARDRPWPIEPDALDALLALVAAETGASAGTGGWTLEHRASGELEAHAMIEILDAPDRAHVRITLLRDRRGHELVTLACIGAETTGSVEGLLARALDRALDPRARAPAAKPTRTRARRTSATDLGRRVVDSFVATAEGRPALPLGWRWTAAATARRQRAWPRSTEDTELLFESAAALLLPAAPVRWTRTWKPGGPVLLRATLGLGEAAVDVRFPGSRGERESSEVASVEIRAPSASGVVTVAQALDRALEVEDARGDD